MDPAPLRRVVNLLPARASEEFQWVLDALAGKLSIGGTTNVREGDVHQGEVVLAANRCEGDLRGGLVRAVNVFHGDILAGSLKACNLLVGAIKGGKVEAANVILGDLLHGSLRGVNVMVGNVKGGSAHSLNAVIGNVYDGSVSGVHVLAGNVYGGVVETALLMGEIKGGRVRAEVHLGRRTHRGEASRDAGRPLT